MLLKLSIVVAILVVAVFVFAATKPNSFHLQRSIVIGVPPERVFALIDDLHNWPRWAPQDREDPTMKRTFEGPASGKGAISDWSGSGNTGKGHMTIIESVPVTRISLQVDWEKPFRTRNRNQFTLEPLGASTRVTWETEGENLYIMKLMSVFMNMDRMMGQHFEYGLANLKAVAEQ